MMPNAIHGPDRERRGRPATIHDRRRRARRRRTRGRTCRRPRSRWLCRRDRRRRARGYRPTRRERRRPGPGTGAGTRPPPRPGSRRRRRTAARVDVSLPVDPQADRHRRVDQPAARGGPCETIIAARTSPCASATPVRSSPEPDAMLAPAPMKTRANVATSSATAALRCLHGPPRIVRRPHASRRLPGRRRRPLGSIRAMDVLLVSPDPASRD